MHLNTNTSLYRLAISATALLGALGLLALLELLLTESSISAGKSEVSLPHAERIPADALVLEQSLALLDAQITQHEGLSFHNEKPLQAAIAAITVEPGEPFPAIVADFVLSAFPTRGHELQLLLECFYYYKQAETKTQSTSDTTPESALAQLVQLQTGCFGDPVATRLFSQYRDMYQSLRPADKHGSDESGIQVQSANSCHLPACQALREITNGL